MTIPGEHRKITVVDATHLAAPITELEQARAHLRQAQNRLAGHRAAGFNQFWVPATADPDCFAREKADVLAALSWVWDAQERAEQQEADGYFKSISRLGYNTTSLQITAIPADFWKKWKRANRGRASFVTEPPFAVGDLIYDYSVKIIDGVTGESTLTEARPYADRFYRSPRRPTRRAAAPASRGRRRRS